MEPKVWKDTPIKSGVLKGIIPSELGMNIEDMEKYIDKEGKEWYRVKVKLQ